VSDLVCASGVELLMDYLDGAVTDDVRAALDAHVAGCRRCQAFVEGYRATPEILRRATAVKLPEDLASSLLAAVRARAASPPPDAGT
jgi:anti-sigma factor RsiW